MRRINIISLILLLMISGLLYAGVTLQYFTGRTQGESILIEWKTLDEDGTVKFDIERSAVNPNNFIYINSLNAKGNNSYYSYLDNSVEILFSPTNNSIYYYRLKCIKQDGSYSYTNYISVVHSVSGIKSTWGSIKAIFR